METQDYINLITSEHKKERFKSWTKTLIEKPNSIQDIDRFINAFLIDSAIGIQLDTLGLFIGIKRNLTFQPAGNDRAILDDDMYRKVLKANIARNHWDGTNATISQIWADIYSDSQLTIIDNQDMTMAAMVTNLGQTPLLQELINHGYIIPKPQCVGLKIIFREIIDATHTLAICAAAMDYGRIESAGE